jgi:hypothetical protein
MEISQDNFESTLFTFYQTLSPEGWDNQKYGAGKLVEFMSPKAMKPGKYQWRFYALIEKVNQWTAASRVRKFEVRGEPMGLSRVSPLTITNFPECVSTQKTLGL